MNTMFELNRNKQTTLILVTHDAKLASKCNREIVLDAGSLIKDSNT
jgi:putative ABC transport system ATP-binding protein